VDAKGTVHAWADPDASGSLTIAAALDFDPYGRSLGAVSSAVPAFAFQGKYQDAETGLVFFGFRWYDPATAKWLSSDPIQEAGGLNLYAFCQGDPVNGVEYLGAVTWDEIKALLGFALFASGEGKTVIKTIEAGNAAKDFIAEGATTQVPSAVAETFVSGEAKNALIGFYSGLVETATFGNYYLEPDDLEDSARGRSSYQGGRGAYNNIALPGWQYGLTFYLGTRVPVMRASRTAGLALQTNSARVSTAPASISARTMAVTPSLPAQYGPRVSRMAQSAKSLATNADEAVFWSGIHDGPTSAAKWASQHGGVTLETTLSSRGIKLPVWDPSNTTSVAAWRRASEEFAAGARGNIRVLQADSIRIRSTWAEIEWNTLRNNPNVTSIRSVNSMTGEEVLLWKR
jgi:RHS repeat-associated protein